MDPTHRIVNLTNEIVTLPTTLPFYDILSRNQKNSDLSFIVAYKREVTFFFWLTFFTIFYP